MDSQMLSCIRFRAPTQTLADKGLIAWADFEHGLIGLHGIEVRRRVDGILTISFPPARTLNGRLSCSAKPISDRARQVIQCEIIAAAAREGWIR